MITVSTNQPEFQAAMREYLELTTRDISTALNQTLFYIARGASRETPRADRVNYERQLGATSYRAQTYKKDIAKRNIKAGAVRRDKRGNVRFERVMKTGAQLVHLIINSRRGKAGEVGLYGAKMKSAENALFSKRARSVGTLRAGWLGAIRALAQAVGDAREVPGAARRIEGRSTASIAKPGINSQASLSYNTNSFDREHRAYIDERIKTATQRAFDAEAKTKIAYVLKKRMEKSAAVAAKRTSNADVMKSLLSIVPELANNPGGMGGGRIPMRTKGF